MALVVESSNQAVNAIAGWNNVGAGAVAQATGLVTLLTLRWKLATASETAPSVSIAAGGDHIVARIITFSGCDPQNPINATAIGTDNGTGTAFSVPGTSTVASDCLVCAVVATGTDITSTAMASGWTSITTFANPSLTEQMDNWHLTGNGGGFAMAVGGKAAAGTYNAITGTLTTGNTKAMMSFAIKGPAVGDPFTYTAGMRGSGPMY
jgi:hypothetical protein